MQVGFACRVTQSQSILGLASRTRRICETDGKGEGEWRGGWDQLDGGGIYTLGGCGLDLSVFAV